MKYICHTQLGIIAFEQSNSHQRFVEMLGLREADITSAGFIGTTDPSGPHLECRGESQSLGKAATEVDTRRVDLNVRMSEQVPGRRRT